MSADRAEAWRAYVTYMQRRHRAKATIEQYAYALFPFWRWCAARRLPVGWAEVTPELLEAFLNRPSKGLAPASRSHYATLIVTAYRFFHADGWLPAGNPLARASAPAWPAPDPRDLTLEQVGRLLDHVAGNPRLTLLVMLCYCAGLRCGEVATLEAGDVDLLESVGQQDGRLVRSAQTGAPVGKSYVSKLLSAALRSAGLDETAHALRHAFAKRLLEADDGRMDTLRAVSRMLGHSSTATTERIYLNGSDAGCQRAIGLLPDPRTP